MTSVNRMRGDAVLLSRDAWEEAALEAITRGGLKAAGVVRLARTLGVTKGSFYWHFESHGELLECVLRRWEKRDTDEVIQTVEAARDPRERLIQLFRLVTRAGKSARLYLALTNAASHPTVRPFLARVATLRIGYLTRCFEELGLDAGAARTRALLVYAAFGGLLHLGREAPGQVPRGDEWRRYVEHTIATLIPPAPAA